MHQGKGEEDQEEEEDHNYDDSNDGEEERLLEDLMEAMINIINAFIIIMVAFCRRLATAGHLLMAFVSMCRPYSWRS